MRGHQRELEEDESIRHTITVVKVEKGAEEVIAAVPGSCIQAAALARQYADKHPEAALLIKRGEKVLFRMEPLYKKQAA